MSTEAKTVVSSSSPSDLINALNNSQFFEISKSIFFSKQR